jgi:DNA replication protein DnaC
MNNPFQMTTPDLQKNTCRECGTDFDMDLRLFSTTMVQIVKVCPACSEKHAFEHHQRRQMNSNQLRNEEWKRICPADFRGTIPQNLPHPHHLEKTLAWRYGPRGLLLYGGTGKGKSRCAWEVMKREFYAGRTIESLNSMAGIAFASKYAASAGEAGKWIIRLITVDLLLLDDVFKSKFTDSFEGALFTIISQRTERQKPIIITSNDTGASLIERMSPDRGEPLVRRLREHCSPINFG